MCGLLEKDDLLADICCATKASALFSNSVAPTMLEWFCSRGALSGEDEAVDESKRTGCWKSLSRHGYAASAVPLLAQTSLIGGDAALHLPHADEGVEDQREGCKRRQLEVALEWTEGSEEDGSFQGGDVSVFLNKSSLVTAGFPLAVGVPATPDKAATSAMVDIADSLISLTGQGGESAGEKNGIDAPLLGEEGAASGIMGRRQHLHLLREYISAASASMSTTKAAPQQSDHRYSRSSSGDPPFTSAGPFVILPQRGDSALWLA